MFVAAGIMWGSYTALLRHWSIPVLEGTSAVASISALTAAVAIGPWAWTSLSAAAPNMVPTQILMQGLVGGVFSVVALVATLRSVSAQTAAMLPIFTPAAAMMIAWAALGTRPAPVELLGAAIVCGGLALRHSSHGARRRDVQRGSLCVDRGGLGRGA
ncbi:MAG: EamA family transporter [Pseudomonadota bacterium]